VVKEIVKASDTIGKLILEQKCISVKKNDKAAVEVARDLLDTAKAYEGEGNGDCVGLASNQIGSNLRVIVVKIGDSWVTMFNPIIAQRSTDWIENEEGCLSLEGTRTVKRYCGIKVVYTDSKGKSKSWQGRGLAACIIQHEIDHLNGRLI